MKNGQTHLQPERKEMASQWLVTKRLSFRQCEATCCGLWLRDPVHHSNHNASGGGGGGSKWIQKRGEGMTERDFQGFYDPDHTSLEAAK